MNAFDEAVIDEVLRIMIHQCTFEEAAVALAAAFGGSIRDSGLALMSTGVFGVYEQDRRARFTHDRCARPAPTSRTAGQDSRTTDAPRD